MIGHGVDQKLPNLLLAVLEPTDDQICTACTQQLLSRFRMRNMLDSIKTTAGGRS